MNTFCNERKANGDMRQQIVTAVGLLDGFAAIFDSLRKRKVSHKWQKNTANAWQRTKPRYF